MSSVLMIPVILGELALLLNLGGKLFGTYARTPLRAVIRIAIAVGACCVLMTPALLSFALDDGTTSRGLWLSAGLGILVLLHYLFPLHFGIRRVMGRSPTQVEVLLPGVRLRSEGFTSRLVPAAADGFECLVLSDFHCNTRRKLTLLCDIVNALRNVPSDCVFILGDLGEKNSLLRDILAALAELPEKHGKFLVRSNHDFEGGREELVNDLAREFSIRVLANETITLPALGLSFLGLEYPWNEAGSPTTSHDTFTIGLSHTPDNLIHFARLQVPVCVAGHTHGGKIRLPLLGALLVPSRFGRLLDYGWFAKGETRMFITKGIGYFPGLAGSLGEVVRLRLERGE